MTRTARLKAYAKLNLGLRVLYKRPDGFHELRTVFQTVSLADQLDVSFTTARATQVLVEGTPHIEDNLVAKAAHLVLGELRIRAHVHFQLKKHIPAGAGLGGGSTDAAAVLLALPVLAGKPIPLPRLFELAGRLGSDVPFFLHGGTALGLGRGEELYPLPDQPKRLALLVAPQVHSSTAEAYRDLSERLTLIELQNKLSSFQREVWQAQQKTGPELMANDFEEVVFARHPELKRIRDRLRRAGAKPAVMTGSGSAIFGIFSNPGELNQARKSFDGEQTFALSFLSRAQYRSAWRRALSSQNLNGDLWPPQSLYAR